MNRYLWIGLLAGVVLSVLPAAQAQKIRWDNGDGGSNTIDSATWNDLQAAITNAEQGAATVGTVKISGNFQRASNDVAVGDLEITGGNIQISGGWSSNFLAQSGKSTLDVNGSNTAGNQFRVLTITGTNTTVSSCLITGGGITGSTSGGGILVQCNSVTLTDLRVANNSTYDANNAPGGGISVRDAGNVLISRCAVVDNYGAAGGGGINVEGSQGGPSTPVIIEYCDIRGNSCAAGSSRIGGGLRLYWNQVRGCALVANCRIAGNRASLGAGLHTYFSIDDYQCRLVVFGCLFESNREADSTSQGGAIVTGGNSVSGRDGPFFANCTVADNVNTLSSNKKGIYVGAGNWGTQNTRFINSIISSNNGTHVDGIMTMATSPIYGNGEFQRTTLNEPVYEEYRHWQSLTDLVATAYVDALAFANPAAFRSVSDSGTLTQNMEENIEGDPGFLGKPGRMCWLTARSNSRNNALTRTGGSGDTAYTYVDVNGDGDYDARLDVIVAGTPPVGDHFVYKHDVKVLDRALAGADLTRLNPNRVIERKLDRGACEFEPPAGLVVFLK
jgi:hypothetical protein